METFNRQEYEQEFKVDYRMSKLNMLLDYPLLYLFKRISPAFFKRFTDWMYTRPAERCALEELFFGNKREVLVEEKWK